MSRYRNPGQRRRKRWSATLEQSGELSQKMILAYTPESVRDWYERRGYIVHRVDPVTPRRSTRPQNQAWEFDERAIREAKEFLGLTRPVSIKTLNHASQNWGEHRLTANLHGVTQRITVKRWLSPEDASRTLWHELTHAMQAQRILAKLPEGLPPRVLISQYKRARECGYRTRYEDKPIEREAREHEAMHDVLPLTRAI